MSASFDAIVVGVGAMGSAACHRLALRGLRVLGLEQFEIGHALGSSGGDTRLIRLAYYEHPDYVPLLRCAYRLWEELEAASGEKLFYRTGGLYIGPPDGELIAGSRQSALRHGLAHELLDRGQLVNRYPQFTVPDNCAALYEPDAGFVLCQRIIAAQARLAVQHGATIRAGEPARTWSADDRGVTVTTDAGTYTAQRLIFTAGPWTGKLVAKVAGRLTVTRQVLGWVRPPRADVLRIGSIPCWAVQHENGLFYGMPMRGGEDSLKVAYHHRGPAAEPDTLDRRAGPSDEAEFRPLLARYLPVGDGPVQRMHVCMYTYSPDGHFIVDRHPGYANVFLACGFSGHGFKFASVIGEALANLAAEDQTPLPVEFLSLRRFGAAASTEVSD